MYCKTINTIGTKNISFVDMKKEEENINSVHTSARQCVFLGLFIKQCASGMYKMFLQTCYKLKWDAVDDF